MMSRRKANVVSVDNSRLSDGIQKLTTEFGPAISYTEFADIIEVGNAVLLNSTATDLNLGTGGYDFVVARLHPPPSDTPRADRVDGHLLNARYTPFQLPEHHVEEDEGFDEATKSGLLGMPVVVCELHSMVAPVASALKRDNLTAAYVMTDSAALSLAISDLVVEMRAKNYLAATYAIGQATAGPSSRKSVSIHGALLHAKHIASPKIDVAIVAPGPGQTGTGTKYGFSGIEQASILDAIDVLGGTSIACVRASSRDSRERHRGLSHHSRTILELVRSRCTVALPESTQAPREWVEKHDVQFVEVSKTQRALDFFRADGINVTTMGRGMDDDPLFFHTAAAAGTIAAQVAADWKARKNG